MAQRLVIADPAGLVEASSRFLQCRTRHVHLQRLLNGNPYEVLLVRVVHIPADSTFVEVLHCIERMAGPPLDPGAVLSLLLMPAHQAGNAYVCVYVCVCIAGATLLPAGQHLQCLYCRIGRALLLIVIVVASAPISQEGRHGIGGAGKDLTS